MPQIPDSLDLCNLEDPQMNIVIEFADLFDSFYDPPNMKPKKSHNWSDMDGRSVSMEEFTESC